uniref:Peptidase_M13 domain-containing protein n=1 Tax=Parastrongyloides trichosuri TaxID=131310 RepID=A0A0N4ZHM5_PARTI
MLQEEDSSIYNKDFSENINSTFTSEYLDIIVDKSVDPCKDFYQFSCGKWLKSNSLSENDDSISFDSDFVYNIEDFKKDLFSKRIRTKSKVLSNIEELNNYLEKNRKKMTESDETLIKDVIGYAVSSMYLEHIYNTKEFQKNIKILRFIMKGIKNELKYLFNEKQWLEDKLKIKLMEKVDEITYDTDHADFANLTILDFCYKHFKIYKKENIKKTVSRIKKFLNYSRSNLIIDDFQCRDFLSDSITRASSEDASYAPSGNLYSFSIPSIRYPNIHSSFPMSLIYGYFGYTFGHEILHGFDNDGIEFDHRGEENETFFTGKSKKEFKKLSKCFVNQYNKEKYGKLDVKHNGTLTLNENIADNGSIKLAHRSYMKYLETAYEQHIKIPRYEKYSNEQLFFIGVGRNFCEHRSRENDLNLQKSDPHSHSRTRTNLMLANYKPFSKAFNCPIGAKMNPIKKCILW